jgi:hypothetical protein
MILCKQQHTFDCVLASLSTVLDLNYEKTWPLDFIQVVEEKAGCYGDQLDRAFELAGVVRGVDYWCVPVDTSYQLTYPKSFYNLIRGRRAVLQVPSLNIAGRYHAVAWDGSGILDPSTQRAYSRLETPRVLYIWLFNELQITYVKTVAPENTLYSEITAVASAPEGVELIQGEMGEVDSGFRFIAST